MPRDRKTSSFCLSTSVPKVIDVRDKLFVVPFALIRAIDVQLMCVNGKGVGIHLAWKRATVALERSNVLRERWVAVIVGEERHSYSSSASVRCAGPSMSPDQVERSPPCDRVEDQEAGEDQRHGGQADEHMQLLPR